MSATAAPANMNEVFLKPAVKLFIGQLQKCRKNPSHAHWDLTLTHTATLGARKNIEFLVAWVQGTVDKINGDTVLLMDETGSVEIRTPSLIGMPANQKTLQTGMYCSAVGEVSEVGRAPRLRAYKFTVIDSDILKPFWHYEVEDYQRFLIQQNA